MSKARCVHDGMTWVEGQQVNARGDECWTPLYCSQDPRQAKAILNKLLNDSSQKYEDFRVVRPEDQRPFRVRSIEVARFSRGMRLQPTCPGCGSAEGLMKIKRNEMRLWKCSCGRRWAREGAPQPLRRGKTAKVERVDRLSQSLREARPITQALESPSKGRTARRQGSQHRARS